MDIEINMKKDVVPSHFCPVCSTEGIKVKVVNRNFIKKQLTKHFETNTPKQIVDCNYDIMRCPNCYLEWSSPLHPGSNLFYEWVTSQKGYYPESRWEWDLIPKLFNLKKKKYLLEIGCGSGAFLERCKRLKNIHAIGLDTNYESVEICRSKKLNSVCTSLEKYIKQKQSKRKYDYVVAFHCLEHVSNPKQLFMDIQKICKKNAKIYISTPYTTIGSDPPWYEVLNYPPHHMTRWNIRAYQALARELHLNFRCYMPKPENEISRTIMTLKLSWYGQYNLFKIHIYTFLFDCIKNFRVTISELVRQLRREQISITDPSTNKKQVQTVSSVILLEFYK